MILVTNPVSLVFSSSNQFFSTMANVIFLKIPHLLPNLTLTAAVKISSIAWICLLLIDLPPRAAPKINADNPTGTVPTAVARACGGSRDNTIQASLPPNPPPYSPTFPWTNEQANMLKCAQPTPSVNSQRSLATLYTIRPQIVYSSASASAAGRFCAASSSAHGQWHVHMYASVHASASASAVMKMQQRIIWEDWTRFFGIW